ncbi:antiterminator Q family protein [Yersinia pseudotuberculosis]|uniref:antiterminator Q family protein n=1 Tax=Yersinia pseudotuberculosis TaxID=633 RepID=UPI00061C2ECB|nr:antiterminator Q family protein [Yersinia pseudotuberculosis]AXY33943.1 antitermination protein Q [Yersinia pseudotuberculosis]AYX09617.1 antitermination protein Q [Yersinia pseudotuberculosis]PEI13522.1 antitermination protein Q [Yersinia pseudotuberculosis]CNJ12466.1 phage antitermination protein Q [Yersinia pseudotuberculosis]
MRRNMQLVFERWGWWAASEEYCSLIDWPAMSVAPQQLPQASGKPGCTDEDGLTLDTCIAHMSTVFPQASLLILGQRYIGGHSLRQIADVMEIDINVVRRSLQASEAFLGGCLVMLGIRLEMDPEVVEPEPVACTQKPMLIF